MKCFVPLIILLAATISIANDIIVEVVKESEQIQKQIFIDDYMLMNEGSDTQTKMKLNSLVEELNSLTFQLKLQKVQDTEKTKQQIQTDVQPETIDTAKVIDEFKIGQDFSVDPNSVVDPVKLGNVLFNRGLYEKAAIYYQKALEDIEKKNSTNPDDHGWVLLQLGNCFKQTDSEKAVAYYQKLLKVLPDSRWSKIALVQKNLAELMLNEKQTLKLLNNKGSIDG